MAEAQNEFQDMSSMFRQEINVSRASIAIVGQDCRAKDELVQIVLGARYHSIVDVSPRQNNRMRFERQTLAYNTNTGEVREKHRDDILLDFLCHFYVRCQSEKTNKKVVKKKRLVKKSSKVPVRRKSSTTSVTTTTSEVITPPVIIGESCFERLPTETEYLSKEVQGHQEGLCHESPVLLKKTLRVDEDGDFKEMERLIVENLDESIECGEVMESIPKSARSVKEGEVTVVEVHQNEVAGSMTLKPVGSVSSEVTVVEQEGEMLITEFEQEGGNVITEIQEEGAKVITVEKTIPPDREEEVINIIEELITNLETRTEKRLLVGSSSEDPDVVVEGVQMIQKSADDDGSETITTEYKEEFEDSLEIKTSCKDEVCASSQAPKKKAATKDTTKKKGAQKSKIQDSKLSSKTNKKTSSPENKAKTTKGSRKVSLSSPESKTKTTKGSRKVSLSSPESKTKTLQKLAEDSKLPKPVAKATKKKSKATSKPEGTKSNLIRSKAESDLTRSDSTDSVLSECDSSEEQYFKEIYLILRQTQVYQKFVELLLTNAPSVYRRSDQFQREALIDLFQVHGNAYYNTHNTIIPRNSSFLIVSHRQDSAVSPNVEPSTPSADNNSFESLSQLQGEYARKFWRTACEESKTKYMYVHGSDRLNIHSNVQYINALESGNNTAIIRYHNKSKEDLQNRIFSSTVTAQSFPFGFLLFEILMNNEKSQFIKFKRLQFLNRLCRLGRISEEALQTHLVDNFNILPPQIYDESSQVNFVVSAPDKFVAFLQKLMNASTTNNTNNHQAVMRQSINELCSTCRFHDDGELRMFLRWIVMYLGHFGLVNLTTTTSVESAEDLNKLEWVLTQTEEWKFQDTMEKDSFQRMSSAHASMHNGSFCVMGDDCRGKNELLALFNFTTGAMVEAPAEKGFRFGRLMCAMNINTKEVKRASVYEVLLRMLCSLYMRSKAQKRVIKNGSNSIPISVGKDEVSSTNVVTKRKRVIEYQGQNISNTEKNSVQENHMSGTEITAGEDVSVRSAQNDIEFLREAASKTRVYSEFLSMLKTDTTAVEKLSDRFDNEVYFNILKTCGGKEFAGYHEFLTPSDTTHLVVSEDNSKGGQQSASNKDDVLVSSRKSKNMYSKFKYLAEMKQGDNRSIVLEERSKSDALQFVADSVAREDSVSLEAVLLAMIVSSSEDALMTHRSYDTLLKRCAKTESGREKLERFLSENNLLLTFENLSKISTEEDNTKVWFSEGENEERLTKVKHDISYEEEEKATKDKSSHEEEEAQNYAEYVITDPARFADLLAAGLNPIVANQRAVAMAMKEGLTRICTQGSEMSAKLRWILRVLQRMGCIEDLGMLDLQGKEDIDMKQLDAITWKFPHAQQDVSLQQDFSHFVRMSQESIAVRRANLAVVGDDGYGKQEVMDIVRGTRFANKHMSQDEFCFRRTLFSVTKTTRMLRERNVDDIILSMLCSIYDDCHPDNVFLVDDDNDNKENYYRCDDIEPKYKPAKEIFDLVKETPIYKRFLTMLKNEPTLVRRKAKEVEEEDYMSLFTTNGTEYFTNQQSLLPDRCFYLIVNSQSASTPQSASALKTASTPQSASALKTASTLQGASTPLIASVEQTSGVVSEGKQDQESDDNLVSTTENYWTSVCELNDSQYTIVHAKETKSLYSNVRHVVSCKGRHEYQNTPMHNKNRSEAKKLLTETSFYGSEVPFRYLALVLLLKNQRCPFMRRSRFDELKAHCSQLDPRDDDASKMESFLVGNLLVISPQVDEGIIPLEEQYVIVDPDRFISLLNVCMNLQKQQRPANVVMREAIQEMCLQDGPVDKKELSTLLRWLVTCFHMFGIVVDLDVFFDTLQLSNLSGIEWLVPSNRPEEPKSSLELIGELFLSFETEKFKGNLLFHRQLFHMIVAVFLKNKRILIISLSRYCLVFDSFYGVECQLRLRCLRSPSTGECSYQLSLGQTQHEDHYGCNKTRKRLIRAVRHVLRYCFRTQVEVFTRYAYMCNGALIEYRIVDGMPPHCIQVWFAGHSVVNGDRGCRVLLLDGGGEQTVIEAVTLMLIQYVVYLHSAPLRNRKHMSLNHFLESSKKCFHMKKTKGYPQIHELFDLVIGNATGALLATCLARKQYDPLRIVYDFIADEPRKPEDWLIDVFRTPIQKIFSQRMTVIEKRLEQRFKTDQKKVHPSVPLLAVMNETTNKQENETEEDQINSLSIEGWHSRRNFFEKVVTRYRHGHEQSNANCPIVEGLNLVQEIAKLEGGDGKSKSTIDDCILSLGCGEDLEMDHSRPLHELGWSSNTHCILSHDDHIWRDHSEETQAIRLNPGRVFPLRQNCPKKMVSSYLETLRDSPGRRSGFTIPYGGLAQFPVVGFELDGIASEYDAKSARHWCHADSANELLVEFYVSIEAARLVVNGNFVEMRFSDGSLLTVTARKDALPPLKIFCARLQGNLLKLTLTHTSRYGEVIKVNVEEDETTLAYFVARVDGARSFRNEVERAATRVYAKNLKLAHAGSYACWQDNDLDYGTKYAEMTLRFSLSCVSGHACLVNCVYNGDKCDRRRERVSSCTHCMESMRSVHCDTIASEQNNKEKECFPYCQTCVKSLDSKNTAVKKSTVNVECLSLSLSGTDVTLTEYSFDNRQDVCDVTLKVRCKRWQVPHFDVNLKYKDVHLTGSPMTVKNTGKTLGVLQRYFRPSVMQHATYDFLTMDDVSKVNAKPKQKLCNEQLVLRYARKYKAKVILLSFDRAQNEYYIRLPHHVILPENDIIEKVAYIKYEDVLQDNETGILQEAHSLKSKVKGSLVKVFAREIRGLLADCDESSDCIGEKLRGKMEEEKERMKLMFGETKNSKLEVELICLAELYRTRVVLLSFDHKLQQHVIKRPHDVIMPPSNALVDNTLFMYWDDIL